MANCVKSFLSGFFHVFLIMTQFLFATEGNLIVVFLTSSMIGAAWVARMKYIIGESKREKIANVAGGTAGALLATTIKNWG